MSTEDTVGKHILTYGHPLQNVFLTVISLSVFIEKQIYISVDFFYTLLAAENAKRSLGYDVSSREVTFCALKY